MEIDLTPPIADRIAEADPETRKRIIEGCRELLRVIKEGMREEDNERTYQDE